jgi:hypothetical protein
MQFLFFIQSFFDEVGLPTLLYYVKKKKKMFSYMNVCYIVV